MSQKSLFALASFGISLLIVFSLPQSFYQQELNNPPKSLILLGKNAYEEPVWQEMLALDIVDFEEVEAAFHAYYDDGNHELDEQLHEYWEKVERLAKSQLDGNGNLVSKEKQYFNLLKYRAAKQNPDAPVAKNFVAAPTTYTMQTPNAGNAGRWKNIGPFGDPEVQWSATGNGALDMVEFHPTNPAIMYVAARNRGLWRSDNYGNHWTPLTDHFATPHIRSVEVNQSNPNIMYLGGIDKIWRSTDAAFSWTEVFNISSANVIQEIHSDPNNADRIIATTEGGVYFSTNAGGDWTEVFDGRFVHLDISEDWGLMITADDNDNVDPTLSYSFDKGDTWQTDTITNEYNEVDKFYFAITETNPKQVYAYGLVDGNSPTRFVGLWKSEFDPAPADGITYFPSWNKIKHPTYPYPLGHTQLVVEPDSIHGVKSETSDFYGSINPYSRATWISDFWVSPNNPDRLLTLREKFWGSEDGGISWDWRPSYGSSNWADNRFITMNYAKDTVYWCNDGGIWCAAEVDLFPTEAMVTASGLSKGDYMNSKVVPKNGGICVIEGSEMDVSQMNKDVVMTGGQDIGQIFSRNGRDAHIASADVYRGRMKPNNDSLFHTGGLYVKIDGGSDNYQVYNNINADYHNSDRMYGFTRKNTTLDVNAVILVRSPSGTDAWQVNNFRGEGSANAGGHGWTPVHNQWETFTTTAGIAQIKAGTFEQSRANADIAFLGDENGNRLFITNNLSATQPTWTQLPNAPAASRYRIATHQFNENIVVAATDAGVYISKDKGQTWATRGAIPAGSPSRVVLDKNRTEGIYVMTSMTVYYIDESLSDWIEFNQGQPLHQNVDMRIAYYANDDNRLYVGKYGSGVWGTPLYSVLEENNDMPIADFRIHGNSSNIIYSGETVQLVELSMNYNILAWTVENGGEVHSAGDEKYPTFTLTNPGYYKVTLTATNDNGAVAEVKEHYVKVLDLPVDLACTPINDGSVSWFERLDRFDINGDNFDVPGNEYYYAVDKTFTIPSGHSATFYGIDNYQPGWNHYWKVWIDYNNNGDFEDEGEAIASSDGRVEEFTRDFTPPADAITNTPLRMRITGARIDTPPPSCNITSGDRQTIDLYIKIITQPTITNNHTVQSVNSATIQSDFTGAINILEAGILYSTFDGNLNINNSTQIIHNSVLNNADNFPTVLNDLEYNVTYYYQTYVIDEAGIHYAEKNSFILTPYRIPTSESIHAVNLGDTQWELKGFTLPEGNNITSITLAHGENNFANSTPIEISSLNPNNPFNISKLIDIGAAASYQFRIKVVDNGKTYYSNIYSFLPNQTICIPTITNYVWYKRFVGVTFGSIIHENYDAEAYEDVTATHLGDLEMGQSYSMTMKTRVSSWTNLSYIVYADFNNDNDFDDYNEIIGSASPNGQFTDVTITIPTQDVITQKDLRLRILGHEGGNISSCNSPIGSYKDFTVSILPGDCTGMGHIVSFFEDMDGDGFGNPAVSVLKNCSVSTLTGYANNKKDCDDTNPNVHPNAQEICDDGIDNNCDGYTDSANVALGKTAVNQSSTASGGVASRAVDDNTSGNWSDGSITHTSEESNPYWEVDLGRSHPLDSIILWNRTNCCSDRLSNFYVFLSETPYNSTDPEATAGQAGVWSEFTVDHPIEKVVFQPAAAGRYLRVQIVGTGILSLAEVQAFTCVQTAECTFYADEDGDGYGDPNNALTQADCVNIPVGYVLDNTDFDDTEWANYPGAMEVCDDMDNDNNGQIDEGATYDTTTKMFQNETIPTEIYTASQSITTDQTVTVMTNTDVRFFAGNEIVLKPGFSANAGSKFHAKIIDDCMVNPLNRESPATTRTTIDNQIKESIDNQITLSVFPNPIRGQATIDFNLPQTTSLSLQIYGLNGHIVQELVSNVPYAKGASCITYSPKTQMTGFYYFILKTDSEVKVQKVVILGN